MRSVDLLNDNSQGSETAILVSNLSKIYKIYDKPFDIVAEKLFREKKHNEFQALLDISFEIKKGETVGIIGPNGAGKSTLLKILSGMLDKTSGDIQINGKVSSILELGTGFHDEYTGRENIIMGGMCMGLSRENISSKVSDIIDFTELNNVIDQQFKTYSSGMKARLTFATALSIEPEILIIDEALAAGDSYFVAKSSQLIRDLCQSGTTVLFVSHSGYLVSSLCSRAIWIEDGTLKDIGPASDICRDYEYSVHSRLSLHHLPNEKKPGLGSKIESTKGDASAIQGLDVSPLDSPVESSNTSSIRVLHEKIFSTNVLSVSEVLINNANGCLTDCIRPYEDFTISVKYKCDDPASISDTPLGLAIGIERISDNVLVAQLSNGNPKTDEDLGSHYHQTFNKPAAHSGIISATFLNSSILEGEYYITIGLLPAVPGTADFYELHTRRYQLTVLRSGYSSGAILYPEVLWDHKIDNKSE